MASYSLYQSRPRYGLSPQGASYSAQRGKPPEGERFEQRQGMGTMPPDAMGGYPPMPPGWRPPADWQPRGTPPGMPPGHAGTWGRYRGVGGQIDWDSMWRDYMSEMQANMNLGDQPRYGLH